MPYFGEGGIVSATEVVPISGGYHVVIGLLSGKQEAECNAIMNAGKTPVTKVTAVGLGRNVAQHQETDITVDYDRYRDAKLERGIRSWTLDDAAGNIVPVTLAAIQSMPERDRNTVFVALEKFNAPFPEAVLGESPTAPIISSKKGAAT